MRLSYFVFTFSLFVFTGCNNSSPGTAAAPPVVNKVPVRSTLNDAGTQKLMGLITNYYAVKNALVASKAAQLQNAATGMANAADSFTAFLHNNYSKDDTVTRYDMLNPYIDTVSRFGKSMAGIDDHTCERQRLLFGTISNAMYELLKKVDLKNAGVYHEFCPMAFNEKGGYWLSEEAEIKNPYFGKKMLECGEVTDSLK